MQINQYVKGPGDEDGEDYEGFDKEEYLQDYIDDDYDYDNSGDYDYSYDNDYSWYDDRDE